MQDEGKTREQLLAELYELRNRVAELERGQREEQRAGVGREDQADAALDHPIMGGPISGAPENRKLQDDLHRIMLEQRAILNTANVGISLVRDRKQVWINRKTEEMFQYPSEELLGQTTRKLYPSQEAYERLGREAYPVLSQGLIYETVQELVRRDGSHIWVQYNGRAIDPPDLSVGTLWILEDITERKRMEEELQWTRDELERRVEERTESLLRVNEELHSEIAERKRVEEALRKSEEQYRLLIETANEGIWSMDEDHRTTYVNQAMADMLGYDPPGMLGKRVEEFFFAEDMPFHAQRMEKRHAGKDEVYERRFKRCDGSPLWTLVSAKALKNEEGGFIGSFAMFTDITERKRGQEALSQNRNMLTNILNSVPQSVFWKDRRSVYLGCNMAFARAIGIESVDQIVGKTDYDLPWPLEEAEAYRADDLDVMESNRARQHIIEPLQRVDGTRLWIDTTKVPLLDGEGRVCGVLGVYEDITERRQAEEVMSVRLRILEFSASHSLEELLQKTLDEIGELTNSPIGFYHFVESDQKTLSLQAWSTRTEKEFCKAEGKGLHYGIEQAGVWVDCVHERRPVIHNDYPALSHRKGLPEGHAPVMRELVVPILRSDQIVAIIGIGNKPTDYTAQDVEIVTYLADVAWEVAKHKKTERELSESEARYRILFDEATEGIVLVDPDTGEVSDCNRAFLELTGYERRELIGKPRHMPSSGEKGDLWGSKTFLRHCREKSTVGLVTELVTGAGAVKQVEIKASPLQIGGRRTMQAYFRDITSELLYQREREATIRLLRLLNDDNNLHELIQRLTGFFKEWTGCEAVGVRLKEADDFPYFETRGFPPQFVEVERFLCAHDTEGNIVRDTLGHPVLECMCGNVIRGRFNPALPFFTPKGSFWTNNTTQLLASTTEKERQSRTRNRCNGEGYESVALIPLRVGSDTLGLLQINDRKKNRFTPELMRFLENAADQIAMALSQRESKTALMVSEQRFRDVSEAAGEFIWETDREGCFTYLSERVESVLGYAPREIMGSHVDIFLHEDEVHRYHAFWEKRVLVGEGFRDFEHRARTRSGLSVWLSASAVPIPGPGGMVLGVRGATLDITERKEVEEALRENEEKFRKIFQASPDPITIVSLEDGRHLDANDAFLEFVGIPRSEVIGKTALELGPWCTEEDREAFRSALEAEGAVRNLEMQYQTRRGPRAILASGDIFTLGPSSYMLMQLKDITERKQAEQEKERLESQLRQAQKLEAIGTLAGGIAHDFNNILSPIIGYTEMVMEEIPESSPMRYDLKQVLTAANRAKELVKQILSFSRLGEQQMMRLMNIGIIVKEALKLLRASLPSSIEIKQNVRSVSVLADATQIHQVMVNLCTNASHAMEGVGTLDVSLQEVSMSAYDLSELSIPELKPGRYAKLSVKDTGRGMSGDILPRIFDPYFTTKEVGKGTGLGLAVVHGIVKRHGGEIRVRSRLGKGSVFEVFIPMADEGVRAESICPKTLPEGTERILLVDDEPQIAEMGRRMLSLLGYEVNAKTNPAEALDLFRSNPDQFDIIITDYTMPRMVGSDLARECMNIRAEIPIIICTGYSEKLSREEAGAMGIRGFAMKPLDRKQLAELVRSVLDAER